MPNGQRKLSTSLSAQVALAIQQDLNIAHLPQVSEFLIYDDDRQIYRLNVSETNNFYVLKVRSHKATKADDLKTENLLQEYELLEKAWQSARHLDSGYSMSRPVAIWPEEKAMLLSGCSGENLNDRFNQNLLLWSIKDSEIQQRIQRSGYWLGNYHHFSCQAGNCDEVFTTRRKNLDRMLGYLKTSPNSPFQAAQLDAIVLQFDALIKQSEASQVGLVHGNFAFRNILCDSENLNLVDFEDSRIENPAYDIGQFIAEILFKTQFPWIRHRARKWRSAFEQGYAQHNRLNHSIVEAYIGYHLLVHLYEHCARKLPAIPARYLWRFRIRFLARLIAKWLSNS